MKEVMVFEGKNSSGSLENFLHSWELLNYRRVEENVMIEAEIEREKTNLERIDQKKAAGKKKVGPSR